VDASITPAVPILVRKYGGTSLATVERIKTVARDIRTTRDEGFRLVIVVSAMGRTTDELTELARQVHARPPRRELDMLLSVGERITMSLLSMALADEGCPAISFTGSQCGIITDTSHSDARILEVKGDRVREALDQGYIVVVAGYQGVSLTREITTLGRGGSDTTAVALAAALGATRCEILKDVDGVLSADPTLVAAADKHDYLTWEQMREVADSGCGVIHIRAVEYAARYQVPLVVHSSFHSGPGTIIGPAQAEPPMPTAAPIPAAPPTGDESRYRPLVMNIIADVTRIRLTTNDPVRERQWRGQLLAHLDPALTITEWLDSGKGFRWEGLTSQGDLADLRQALTVDAGTETNTWEGGLSCISLTGGRPDSWLEIHRQVAELMNRLRCEGWRLRADGSALRLLLPGAVSRDLAREIHQALVQA